MTVEVAIVLSVISVAFAVYSGICNLKRNQKLDDKNETSQLTTVIVKLESIGTGIAEIKAEMNNVKHEAKEDREILIAVRESARQAHKRLDMLEKKGD